MFHKFCISYFRSENSLSHGKLCIIDKILNGIYIFFSHYMFHHKWLDRVPSATQQDHIANPSQRQHSASIYPKLQVPPTPSPSALATTSLFSKSMIFFSVERFICDVYLIPDISDIRCYLSFSFWLTPLSMRVLSSIQASEILSDLCFVILFPKLSPWSMNTSYNILGGCIRGKMSV